jgi:hypothetical protein
VRSDDLTVAPGTRLVHIGPPKTGTSALQSALHAAREPLASYGVVYPGTTRHPQAAVHAVLGKPPLLGHAHPDLTSWTSLAAEVAEAGDERAVLSSEFFADADEEAIGRVVADLGGPRVHVAVTLRPLARILPSQWQQYVQNGLRMPYETWLDAAFGRSGRKLPTPTFWQRHRHDALVARWSAAVGPERVTVIVLDPAEPGMLLRTFEAMLAVPDGTLVPEEGLTNRSLTYGETELIRLFNKEFRRRRWPEALYPRFMKYGAITQMRAGHHPSPSEARIATPRWALELAAAMGAEAAEAIDGLGVRVVGDLPALGTAPDEPAARPDEPALVSADAACQAVIGAIVAGGATGEMPAAEDLQIRDADAATLMRVLRARGLRRARRSLHRRD